MSLAHAESFAQPCLALFFFFSGKGKSKTHAFSEHAERQSRESSFSIFTCHGDGQRAFLPLLFATHIHLIKMHERGRNKQSTAGTGRHGGEGRR